MKRPMTDIDIFKGMLDQPKRVSLDPESGRDLAAQSSKHIDHFAQKIFLTRVQNMAFMHAVQLRGATGEWANIHSISDPTQAGYILYGGARQQPEPVVIPDETRAKSARHPARALAAIGVAGILSYLFGPLSPIKVGAEFGPIVLGAVVFFALIGVLIGLWHGR